MINDKIWYPVARIEDLAPRHIFHSQLHGVELALWKSDDGQVNAWENRCPHRSVRLTLGVNTGERLRCQYHGWQYRSGDGQCANIPASSQTTPPPSLCARPFPVEVRDGLIWSRLDTPTVTANESPTRQVAVLPLSLRSRVIKVGYLEVAAELANYAAYDDQCQAGSVNVEEREGALELSWQSHERSCHVSFWLQPANAQKTVIHATSDLDSRTPVQIRRWHDLRLTQLCRRLESREQDGVVPLRMPEPIIATQPRPALIEARVRARWVTAEEILAFELVTEGGGHIGFEAGAHIDVHTPSGLVRQYSLVNTPDEREHLVIGVKRESESRGGSLSLHETLAVGDLIKISWPKNNFPLVTGKGALLIAGGIGITPILAMASQLQQSGLSYSLHYYTRSQAHAAFTDRLESLSAVHLHTAFDPQQTLTSIEVAMRAASAEMHIYVCGPRPLVDLVQELASVIGFPAGQVHFELFANEVSHVDDRPFRVRLARSQDEFEVPVGVSLAEALQAHGMIVDTSCEQGVCGTCRTIVLEGEPEHRDVYLSEEERQGQRCLMPCVSRSHSELLVLDL